CPPLARDVATPLLLTGVRDGGIIKRVPGQRRLPLQLTSQGGEGQRWWFVNGMVQSGHGDNITVEIESPDDYQVLVMDDAGQTAVVRFTVQ
ncbi:MAG TPA: penicillin-binding protein 1C, partial [Atlantibacter hermannii]|nr:penicillin-binding protein 1C [Atlantibacter hermannii]